MGKQDLVHERLVECETFLRRTADGGQIVSSGGLSSFAIAEARACGRMIVLDGGLGFVYQPAATGMEPDETRELEVHSQRVDPTGLLEEARAILETDHWAHVPGAIKKLIAARDQALKNHGAAIERTHRAMGIARDSGALLPPSCSRVDDAMEAVCDHLNLHADKNQLREEIASLKTRLEAAERALRCVARQATSSANVARRSK